MGELICLLVQARTARLGRARGASSDLILCSSTALTSHSKLCPLLPPVAPGRKTLQSIALPVLIKQKTTLFFDTLAYLIYRHFYPPAREIRSTSWNQSFPLFVSRTRSRDKRAYPSSSYVPVWFLFHYMFSGFQTFCFSRVRAPDGRASSSAFKVNRNSCCFWTARKPCNRKKKSSC